MTLSQHTAITNLHRRYTIIHVAEWDYQPGVVFIEYIGGTITKILPDGTAIRLARWPDSSLGRIYDVTQGVTR